MEAKVCPDGSTVGRTGSLCEFAACPETSSQSSFITITSLKQNESISSPLQIKGMAKPGWGVFEGIAGKVTLYDPNHTKLAEAQLKATTDWTKPPIQFEATLIFGIPSAPGGTLEFISDNPSGIPKNEQRYVIMVGFEPNTFKSIHQSESENYKIRKINLFYYDKTKDADLSCSPDAVLPVAREIPFTLTPIQDSVKLLLKGVLSDGEKLAGWQTEFPLDRFALNGVRSENGTFILQFDDLEGRSGGGSCRTRLLWSQISKTVLQFPEVKGVKFEPETLFQP